EVDPSNSAPVLTAKKLKDSVEAQRVVEFYAKDCPHSQALEPIWKSAEKDWKAANHDAKLIWQQKECYTTDWKKGKDFKECQEEGIESFPTIKYYYGKKDQFGEEILEHSDKDRLLDFVESRADPQAWDQKTAAFGLTPEQEDAGLSASWGDGQYMQPAVRYGGGRVVDYFSQDCVHCKHLKPVWKNAQHMWAEKHPGAKNVEWEEKECFGARWEPGKDYGECQTQGIHSFPTVRFHPYNSEDFEDFTAQRTAKNLLNFVEDRAQAPDGADAAVPPAAPAEVPAPVVAAKAPSEVKHTDATHESHEKHAPQEPHESHEADRVPAESESIKKPTSPSMKGEVAKVAAQVDDLKGPEQAMLPLPAPFAPPVQCRRLKDFL
ncbi:unnamed protein product, partial [Durusdinium trenchii]